MCDMVEKCSVILPRTLVYYESMFASDWSLNNNGSEGVAFCVTIHRKCEILVNPGSTDKPLQNCANFWHSHGGCEDLRIFALSPRNSVDVAELIYNVTAIVLSETVPSAGVHLRHRVAPARNFVSVGMRHVCLPPLTEQQAEYFHTFGFLVLRGYLRPAVNSCSLQLQTRHS
eukprot:COSAG01_NODE_32130_length_586_cov_0.640657_1_plen_172_part_00